MPSYQTHGYDLVAMVSEEEVNAQLATLFASGKTAFPQEIRRPIPRPQDIPGQGPLGQFKFLFDTPWFDFSEDPASDPNVNRYDWNGNLPVSDTETVTLFIPFSEASISFTNPRTGDREHVSNIDGCIALQQPIEVFDVDPPEGEKGTYRNVGLDFTDPDHPVGPGTECDPNAIDGVHQIHVGLTSATVENLDRRAGDLFQNRPGTPAGMVRQQTSQQVERMFECIVFQRPLLQQPIRVQGKDGTDALAPNSIDVRVIRESSGGCLAFLMQTVPDQSGQSGGTTPDGAGQPGDFTRCVTDQSSPAVAMVNTATLLAHEVCPKVAESLGIAESQFDAPCQLRNEASLPTDKTKYLDDLRLTTMEVTVEDGRIQVHGNFEGGGQQVVPYDVHGWFTVQVELQLEDGEVTTSVASKNVDVILHFPEWVTTTSELIGLLTGGVGGAIAAQVVSTVAMAVGTAVADNVAGNQLGSKLSELKTLSVPLGPAADGFSFTGMTLTENALVLKGEPTKQSTVPVAASGVSRFDSPVAVDLDRGETYDSVGNPPGTVDLTLPVGGSANNIEAHGSAHLAPIEPQSSKDTNSWYFTLTPVDLEQVDYEGSQYTTAIPMSRVPSVSPIGSFDPLVFAVRTSENRYAKCRAYRIDGYAQGISGFYLNYVTFDRPTPDIFPAVEPEVIDREPIDSGTAGYWKPNCLPSFRMKGPRYGGGLELVGERGEWTEYAVARRIEVTADPQLMAFPIRSVKWKIDSESIEGSGTYRDGDHKIEYEVHGRTCVLTTELGKDIDVYLEAVLVDDRGISETMYKRIQYDTESRDGPYDLVGGGGVDEVVMCAEHDFGLGLNGPIPDVEPGGGVRPDPPMPLDPTVIDWWADDVLPDPGGVDWWGSDVLPDPGGVDWWGGDVSPGTRLQPWTDRSQLGEDAPLGGEGPDDAGGPSGWGEDLRTALEEGMDLDLTE